MSITKYGANYWNELLTGWLSVDPMMDKYPGLSPYNYCAWNPVKLVDPDGEAPFYPKPTKGVRILTINCNVGIGVGYAGSAAAKRGYAFDRRGVTHFKARAFMYCANQNLDDGSSNPAFLSGAGIGGSVNIEYNSSNSFLEAISSNSSALSVGIKGLLGGDIGVGNDVFSLGIGIGLGADIAIQQWKIKASISLSWDEANIVGIYKQWNVSNIKLSKDESGNFFFSGTVNNTDINVKCKAIKRDGKYIPNNIWASKDYENE